MTRTKKVRLPVLVEKDEDGFFVVECPLLQGCYTQGKTLDEALKNIHEVIEMCVEEQKEEIVEQLDAIQEFSYHVVSVEV
jgi:predicted RNase H-like HicB family nuclease